MWRDIWFTYIIENQYRKVLIMFPYEENHMYTAYMYVYMWIMKKDYEFRMM